MSGELRWVEDCVPDKPGLWAVHTKTPDGWCDQWSNITEHDLRTKKYPRAKRCFFAPPPVILPPKQKVVQRAYMAPVTDTAFVDGALFELVWISPGDKVLDDWVMTCRTREVME